MNLMSRRKQDKLRDQRLNSGPSTKLVSKGGRSKSRKSHSRKRSSSNGGLYTGNGQSQKPRNPYSRKQIAIMALILIAFICGILMGAAYIFGDVEEQVTTYEINETEVNNTTIKNNTHIRNRTNMQENSSN